MAFCRVCYSSPSPLSPATFNTASTGTPENFDNINQVLELIKMKLSLIREEEVIEFVNGRLLQNEQIYYHYKSRKTGIINK